MDLTTLTEAEFMEHAERAVREAFLAQNFPSIDAECHGRAMAHSAEADRRGKPWLYARAWNRACVASGGTLSEADRAMARTPAAA